MSFEAFGFPPEPPLNLPNICPDCADGNCDCCEPEFEARGWFCDCEGVEGLEGESVCLISSKT